MVEEQTNGSVTRGIPREAILEAAASLFARKGYRATTLSDVARALRIKKASLYHYIRGKEDLLVAIYDRIFDRIEAEVRPIAALDLSADEVLRRMVHKHIEVVAAESAMLAVVFQEEAALAEPDRVRFQRRKGAYERLFEDVIERGQREGVLRPLSPRLMARALLGMGNWLYQWYRPDRHRWQDIAAELTLLLESGWIADGDGRRGAWARPETVDEALAPAREAVHRARAQLDDLSVELARAADRLQDGLARR